MDTRIISPEAFDAAHYEAVYRLMGQLTTRSIEFTEEDYKNLISRADSRLFLLLVEGRVEGMLTVGSYASPTGTKAWVAASDVGSCNTLSAFAKRKASVRSTLPRTPSAWQPTHYTRQ